MVTELSLYGGIIKVAEDYFGPAAPRFIRRIIVNHLQKAPDQVTAFDMPELITWIQLTVAMVTDEVDVIDEFITRLQEL